jgi:hypothetical protein
MRLLFATNCPSGMDQEFFNDYYDYDYDYDYDDDDDDGDITTAITNCCSFTL